ncbi:hypothetical protein [Terribacillus saccharophilus]|uniref:hypothetical protein n=1 Tax=Terribacillus saccharophilus TaxID=361277 RepID=UPI003981DA65
MAIPDKIKVLAKKVREAVFGSEVRDSIATSMEETADIADNAKTAAEYQTGRVDNLIRNNPQPSEIVDVRYDEDGIEHATASERIKSDNEKIKGLINANSSKIGESVSLPQWLQSSLREVSKMHDDYLRNIGVDPRFPPFNAKGDGLSDDTIALQAAIDYCYENKKRLIIPDAVFLISKTLSVYGGYEEDFGTIIIGLSRDKSAFKVSDSSTITSMFTAQRKNQTSEGALHNINIANILLDGNEKAARGLEFLLPTAQCIFERIRIKGVNESGVHVEHNNYLNRFDFIRVDGGQYGFNYVKGIVTSTTWTNPYVVGQTVAGYNIQGIYSTLIAPCADGVTGTVYDLTGFRGTVISPGSESVQAKIVFRGGAYTNCTILDAYTFMNRDDSSATHIVLDGAAGRFNFVNGTINRDEEGGGTATAAGKLYDVSKGPNSLIEFTGTPQIGASSQASDQSLYPKIIPNNPGMYRSHLMIGYTIFDPALNKNKTWNGTQFVY